MNRNKETTTPTKAWTWPVSDIEPFELAQSFTLSQKDLELIWLHHHPHNRLGMALHICWLRYLGWQPGNFRKVSVKVLRFLGSQLNIATDALERYQHIKPRQFRAHAEKAREHLGWKRCGEIERKDLMIHIHAIALQHDQQIGLVDAALVWLIGLKICRPNANELIRLIRQVRAAATDEVIQRINQKLSPGLKASLAKFVETPEPGLPSELQQYLASPSVASSTTFVALMKRIAMLRKMGIEDLDWSDVNANRARGFANMAGHLRPRDLRPERSSPDRANAIIVCALSDALLRMNDDGIEMHEQLMLNVRSRAKAARNEALLANQGMIMRLIGLLHQMLLLILKPRRLLRAIGSVIFRVFRKGFLRQALADCAALLGSNKHDGLFYLRKQYNTFRRFGPHFLTTMHFEHTDAGTLTHEAVQFLRQVNSHERLFSDPPMKWMSKKMQSLVIKPDSDSSDIDRAIWEIFLHERIARDLRAGDLWVRHSREYLPLKFDMAVPATEKSRFLKAFPHMVSAETFLTFLREAYLKILAEADKVLPIPASDVPDPALPIADMTLDPEPPETPRLRDQLFGLVPLRQLPQVLRQVLRWVDFLAPFREAIGTDVRISDLYDRLLFILVGEGCNIGLDNMATATNRYT